MDIFYQAKQIRAAMHTLQFILVMEIWGEGDRKFGAEICVRAGQLEKTNAQKKSEASMLTEAAIQRLESALQWLKRKKTKTKTEDQSQE